MAGRGAAPVFAGPRTGEARAWLVRRRGLVDSHSFHLGAMLMFKSMVCFECTHRSLTRVVQHWH